MPLQATSGAASYDAFGGGVPVVPNYIEDVFSTYLYTGNGSTQTITNGIDLSTKGGLVWFKSRSGTYGTQSHVLTSNELTNWTKYLSSNTTGDTAGLGATAFTPSTTGFALNSVFAGINDSGTTYASWTFRKAEKFFDVVTWTGNGTAGRTISHNLGSVPGAIFVKQTNASGEYWDVYHRSLANNKQLYLNATDAQLTTSSWNSTTPTSTVFTVGDGSSINANGSTYVAYLFAHNAGGFGLTGTDNVISCGLTTANGSGDFSVNLGYEPQWVLMKSTGSGIWSIVDNMRGATASSGYTSSQRLQPQSSAAEDTLNGGYGIGINATGFTGNLATFSNDFIYIAIRRGPMKVPTSGTSVYETVTSSATAGTVLTTGFPVDLQMQAFRSTTGAHRFMDRLRGVSTNSTAGSISLASTSDAAETSTGSYSLAWNNTGFQMTTSFESTSGVFWNFRRAPSFFDEVCWTRSTTTAALNHNLGVVPELIIKKDRSRAGTYWDVMPNISPYDYRYDIYLNDTQAISGPSSIYWNAAPTATTFDVHMGFDGSSNGDTFVAYLFATCAGVSKVGSYTGTGTTLQVNCGFTGGARFVLIKRTDSTGSWYVWDSSRGIVSGNDPYLLLNSTAAEVTNTDYIDTYSAGFEISSTAPAEINASGGSFIFLAIS